MLGEHIVPQSEVIRAILSEDSPCCRVAHREVKQPQHQASTEAKCVHVNQKGCCMCVGTSGLGNRSSVGDDAVHVRMLNLCSSEESSSSAEVHSGRKPTFFSKSPCRFDEGELREVCTEVRIRSKMMHHHHHHHYHHQHWRQQCWGPQESII